MITSMTGFGRGVAQSSDKRIQIEIKSVNSKQLDISMRIPNNFKEMEISLRSSLGTQLGRGKVELWATVENISGNSDVDINLKVIENYKLKIQEMGRILQLGEPQDWYSLLLRLPDAMKNEESNSLEEDSKLFIEAYNEAVKNLIEFRKQEGKKLYSFFCEKIEAIKNLLEEIKPYEAERVNKIRERLEDQLSRLESIEYDKGRLEQELIYYIEKLDVTEEMVRLRTHLNYFHETLDLEPSSPAEGQGKKLGFIAQEIGREINTLGSKSNQAEMQKIVVKMKDELEQIKEQVMNVL